MPGLSDFTGGGSTTSVSRPTKIQPIRPDDDTDEMLVNYNDRFASADDVLFRDDVIDSLCQVLISAKKANALLVGPAGTGKTAIVEELARRIANDDDRIPAQLKNATVYELPIGNLVAGSGVVGDLEEKVNAILSKMREDNAILFIDEIHQIASSRDMIMGKVAQLLKPALARGDIRCIGATTTQEANDFLDDPALTRRFSRVTVDELTSDETTEVLRHVTPSLIKHYQNLVTIDDDLLSRVTEIADANATAGNHRPDTAITLLDRTFASVSMKRAKLAAAAATDQVAAAALAANPVMSVNEHEIELVAHRFVSGKDTPLHPDRVIFETAFADVEGQSAVIEPLTAELLRYSARIFPQERPLTLLFAGDSGAGKTMVARAIARAITDHEPITLNMTEYHSPASINRIIGSPAGYVGSDSHQELPFDALESNPQQVILLDEFEKGDRSVQRLFMSIFDDGTLTTARGKTIDFSRAIIIATTNAAHAANTKNVIGFGGDETTSGPDIDALSEFFDIELLNRFEHIHTFSPISRETYAHIVADTYKREAESVMKNNRRYRLDPEIDEADLERIVTDTYHAKFGARPAKRAVRELIECKLLDL